MARGDAVSYCAGLQRSSWPIAWRVRTGALRLRLTRGQEAAACVALALVGDAPERLEELDSFCLLHGQADRTDGGRNIRSLGVGH